MRRRRRRSTRLGIGARALDEPGEAAFGDGGALVAGDRAGDALVAALDQHLGDAAAELGPAREREEMVLALQAGDGDEVLLLEPRRALEHGLGHLDRLVIGEVAQDLAGCVRDVGEPLGELGAGAPLDVAREPQDHLVEDARHGFR